MPSTPSAVGASKDRDDLHKTLALEVQERYLKQTRDYFDVGDATRLDVLRAEAALASTRPDLLQARNAQVEAFAQWATLDAASKKATVEAADAGCRSATDAIRQSAAAMECKL